MLKLIIFTSFMSFALNGWATQSAVAGGTSTKAGIRTLLNTAKTAGNVNSTSNQTFYDCGGCPIPNDTGCVGMACAATVVPASTL